MFKSEWLKIFKTRKMLVSIIAVLFIPVLYSGTFLWAFWDPYASLSSMPVAIVNDDTGTVYEGESMDLGKELTNTLIESEQFKFIEVDSEHAEDQLQEMDYYMIIRIPENFSEHATTLLDENPSKLVIDYIPNEGFNFIGSQIGETAMDRIKAEVNTQVSKTYAEKLFASITQLGDGFTEAADGAGQLDEGALKLANGASDLKGYLEQLAASTIDLSDGTSELTTGAKKAATGVTSLAQGMSTIEAGSEQLADGATLTSNGAKDLAQGVLAYTNGVAKVADGQATLVEKQKELGAGISSLANNSAALYDGASDLSNGAAALNEGLSALSQQMQGVLESLPAEQAQVLQATLKQLNEGSTQLAGGLENLTTNVESFKTGASQLNTGSTLLVAGQQQAAAGVNELAGNSAALVNGSTTLAAGNETLASKLAELASGVTTAKVGANELASGFNAIVEGSATINDGTTLLAEKSGELAQGSTTLADGTKELLEGTTTLASKLQEASEQVSIDPKEQNYEMVAQPVEVEKTAVNEVANYGSGFAPYFLSLGLFVGALLISIVFPLVEPAIRPTNAAAWFFSKVSVLGVVGIIQALISVAIVVWGLGLEVESMGWFIFTTILTSFTYLAIIQMLVSIFGDPGRFIAIIVLIIQLTTSAGTFPLELVPSQLQIFNPYFPMTYSVQAFKAAISMNDFSFLAMNFTVLAVFMVACLLITFGYFALVLAKRYSKIEEA